MSRPTPHCLVLGGGGHARVLIDGLLALGEVELVGVLDQDRGLWGATLYGVPVLGGDDLLPRLAGSRADAFAVGLGGVRDNLPRRRLYEAGLAHGLTPLTFVHPRAFCSPRAVLGPGCQLMPMAVVNAGAALGANVIVNSGAVVEHDCRVGDHAHVATGARLCSTVSVGANAHIGAGAVVKQLVRIGDDAVVAAGAAVVKDVPAGALAKGVPAAITRQLG